ncbi:unnamed protein product [Symbiodinium sp. CCMP2592]|nr:unnamed protein product [Symbiodinium sp. CCMP2592]
MVDTADHEDRAMGRRLCDLVSAIFYAAHGHLRHQTRAASEEGRRWCLSPSRVSSTDCAGYRARGFRGHRRRGVEAKIRQALEGSRPVQSPARVSEAQAAWELQRGAKDAECVGSFAQQEAVEVSSPAVAFRDSEACHRACRVRHHDNDLQSGGVFHRRHGVSC